MARPFLSLVETVPTRAGSFSCMGDKSLRRGSDGALCGAVRDYLVTPKSAKGGPFCGPPFLAFRGGGFLPVCKFFCMGGKIIRLWITPQYLPVHRQTIAPNEGRTGNGSPFVRW